MEKTDMKIFDGVKFTLPRHVWLLVCLFSIGIGVFFGQFYSWPGMITAGVGGLVAGLVWCWVMRKIYADPYRTSNIILSSGIGLGIAVGVADGILLQAVGFSLVKFGYLVETDLGLAPMHPSDYFEAVKLGCIWGIFGGAVNGMIWGKIVAGYHRNEI